MEDPIEVYKGKKRVTVDIGELSGVIETSLLDTLKGYHFGHQLATKLTNLYAWTIDFHHLQKGDHYKVIFERQYLAGKPLGLDKILAARFNHRGQDFYAFYYENGDGGKYYDEPGASVEKALLKSPLQQGRITSRFSRARLHPILKRRRPHLGIDFAAPRGTPIVSVGDGTVLQSARDSARGNYLTVRHNGLYSTEYYHLSKFARGIKPGVRVKQGEIIGYVGSTGLATGPHVEFRLVKRGRPVDPLKEDVPSGEPLEKDYLETFKHQTAKLKRSLERIDMANTSEPLQASPTF
jgi:murein DD-endopeptidase MepM/ murein hydrolase activator NlpD